jgi:hypothetical protein
MQTGLAGLALWSFLMANAHGAGLMLIPVLMPLCLSGSPATLAGSAPIAIAAIAVHTLAMLAAIAIVSLIVYQWVGLAFQRSAWINLDLIWRIAPTLRQIVFASNETTSFRFPRCRCRAIDPFGCVTSRAGGSNYVAVSGGTVLCLPD